MLSKRSIVEMLTAVLLSAATANYVEYLAFEHLSWTFKTPGDYLAFYFLPDSLSINPLTMLDLRILVCFVADWTCCFAILLSVRALVRSFARRPKLDERALVHLPWTQRPTQTYICKRLR